MEAFLLVGLDLQARERNVLLVLEVERRGLQRDAPREGADAHGQRREPDDADRALAAVVLGGDALQRQVDPVDRDRPLDDRVVELRQRRRDRARPRAAGEDRRVDAPRDREALARVAAVHGDDPEGEVLHAVRAVRLIALGGVLAVEDVLAGEARQRLRRRNGEQPGAR